MILSGYMMFSHLAASSVHPAQWSLQEISHTYSRSTKITQLIDVSFQTLYEYNTWRLEELQTLRLINNDTNPDSIIPTSSSIPPSMSTTHFFPTSSTMNEMEGEAIDIDFFDSFTTIPEPDDDSLYFDFDITPSTSPSDNPTSVTPSTSPSDNPTSDITPSTLPSDNPTSTSHVHIHTSANETSTSSPLPSPAAYNAGLMGRVDLHPPTLPTSFPVIFDTGASLAISPSKDDFSGDIQMFPHDRFLGGMADGMRIEGVGKVKWSFRTSNGMITIHSKCYYVPASKARLISPQRLFNSDQGVTGCYVTKEHSSTLIFDGVGELNITYDSRSHLPIAIAKNLDHGGAEANLSLSSEENQNLTPSQRLLLLWHAKFGHKHFSAIQRIFRLKPFLTEKFLQASRCPPPKCKVCQYAKGHRKPTSGNLKKVNKLTDGSLKVNDLRAGSSISVDHFESRLKGRTRNSYGSPNSDMYVGGCIFVDHMSNYIHVEHQLGFSSSETIRAKQNFEKLALDHGVLVDSYLADNGVFKANQFVSHIQTKIKNYGFVESMHIIRIPPQSAQ